MAMLERLTDAGLSNICWELTVLNQTTSTRFGTAVEMH